MKENVIYLDNFRKYKKSVSEIIKKDKSFKDKISGEILVLGFIGG